LDQPLRDPYDQEAVLDMPDGTCAVIARHRNDRTTGSAGRVPVAERWRVVALGMNERNAALLAHALGNERRQSPARPARAAEVLQRAIEGVAEEGVQPT
jgi:hypothetical protein